MIKMNLSVLLLVLFFGLPLQAQALTQARTSPIQSDSLESLQPQSRKAWLTHVQNSQNQTLQAGCSPYYLAPHNQAQRQAKGAVILLHGFTACSQQNDGLAPLLAQDGYHVFVPRLPGHGLPAFQEKGIWHDRLDNLPQLTDYKRYQDFAAKLVNLVKSEPGTKSIVGISLGGTLAASTLLQAPGIFDRGLLLTPVFDIVEPQNLILPMLQSTLPYMLMHWGPTCDLERSKNRGGYCDFAVSHVRAMQQFGEDTLSQLDHLGVRIQLVGVEGDGAASNQAILKASRRLPFKQTCLFEQGTSHSMLSPYDNQHENKFWFNSLETQIRLFIADGSYFKQESDSLETGFKRCQSR